MPTKTSISALLAGACALAISLNAAPQTVMDAPGVTVDTNGAELMHRSSVRYPVDLQDKQIQGTVVAQVRTDATGSVIDASITSGPDELRRPVMQSILDWHFTHDSANATRQVTVTFKATPAPRAAAALPARPARAAVSLGPIAAIEVTGLPDEEKEHFLALLPVHVGDAFSSDTAPQLNKIAHDFDEHMGVGMMVKNAPDGTSAFTLRFSLAGAQAIQPASRVATTTTAGVRIGDNVATNNLITQVAPTYPPLAKAARVQGTVRFDATIGKDGTVQNLHLVSGPPLLVQAAMQAVRQWVYKPTLLNGQPVEVVTTIDVNFELPPA
jgi:TonB family protein